MESWDWSTVLYSASESPAKNWVEMVWWPVNSSYDKTLWPTRKKIGNNFLKEFSQKKIIEAIFCCCWDFHFLSKTLLFWAFFGKTTFLSTFFSTCLSKFFNNALLWVTFLSKFTFLSPFLSTFWKKLLFWALYWALFWVNYFGLSTFLSKFTFLSTFLSAFLSNVLLSTFLSTFFSWFLRLKGLWNLYAPLVSKLSSCQWLSSKWPSTTLLASFGLFHKRNLHFTCSQNRDPYCQWKLAWSGVYKVVICL